VTNIVNAAISPAADADADAVAQHLIDDRVSIGILGAAFIVLTPAVYWFVAAVVRVIVRHGYRHAAIAGALAVAGVFTMFGSSVASRLSLVAAVETGAVDSSTVWGLWKLHTVLFAFNAAPLAVAFAAFAIPAAAIGLVPRFFKVLAPIGAALLLASAVLALPMAEASEVPIALGGLGFVSWLAFVLAAGLGLVRQSGQLMSVDLDHIEPDTIEDVEFAPTF
jgi:hypothetical protein